jgi:HEAT repeat protein
MPLVRKPPGPPPPVTAPGANPASATQSSASLSSGDADERWTAARAAAGQPGAVTALGTALLTESDSRVREAMFTSLSRIATPDAADRLVTLLRSDNANLRAGALDALRILIGGMRELLAQLLADRDTDIRILSCELARGLPAAEATPLLCALLDREDDVNVCAAAIDVLTEVGSSAALPSLAACARKFGDSPFLVFAVKTATDLIQSQRPARA